MRHIADMYRAKAECLSWVCYLIWFLWDI